MGHILHLPPASSALVVEVVAGQHVAYQKTDVFFGVDWLQVGAEEPCEADSRQVDLSKAGRSDEAKIRPQ